MEINELIGYLTEGLDEAQAKVVRDAVQRDAVKTKVSGLKAANEYQAIADRAARLESEMNGDAAQGRLGAKAYQEWYTKNEADISKLLSAQQAYITKYGKFDGSFEAPTTTTTTPPATAPAGKQWTEEDIQRAVDARIGSQYAPGWSKLLSGMGTVVQKHMFAGRKTPIDMTKFETLVTANGGNFDKAYDEYDEPERVKDREASTKAEIDRRVNEELQKRGASAGFPGAADAGPSALSAHKGDKAFDREAMTNDLIKTFNSVGAPN